MEDRLDYLKGSLKEMKKVAVAFSGGVDSTFLLKVAVDVLGPEDVLAFTASSQFTTSQEIDTALEMAREIGVEHVLVEIDTLEDEMIKSNPKDRCYHCKLRIFSTFLKLLDEEYPGYVLVEGTNRDDVREYRPGKRAMEELKVLSPLADSGLSKDEIRVLSKRLGISNWSRPSQSCLATRVPYDQELTEEKLQHIEKGETYLKELGFKECRLRYHKDIARIEVPKDEMRRILDLSPGIISKLKELGSIYITLDMEGLRSGSMDIGHDHACEDRHV